MCVISAVKKDSTFDSDTVKINGATTYYRGFHSTHILYEKLKTAAVVTLSEKSIELFFRIYS